MVADAVPGAPYTGAKPTRGLPGTLPPPGLATKWADQLVHLAQAGRTDRLAVGDQPAVGVDRNRAVDLGRAGGHQLLLLAVGAQARLGHVDDLVTGVGVLQLGDVDVLGSDARGL